MADETMNCPRCGKQCWRDSVHNGLTMLYGPWGCQCGWSEYEEYDQLVAEQPANGHVDPVGRIHTTAPTSSNERSDGRQ